MKAFEWVNAASVDEAVKLLGVSDAQTDRDEVALPLAGGQDLLTTMKSYISRPPRVVNLKTIKGLDQIAGDGARACGSAALATLAQVEGHPEIRKSFPALAEAAHSVASAQIRNLGTVGGNLCQRPRCWYYRLESVVCLKKGGAPVLRRHRRK